MLSEKILVADIGNSRIKILNNGFYTAFEYDNNFDDNINIFFQEIFKKNSEKIIFCYSSVNNLILDRILLILQRFSNIFIIDCIELLHKQNKIDFSNISNIGTDRLVGLFRASEIYKIPIISIDCGTAITINALDKSGKVCGGAIFAGVKTQLKSLSESTANLKEIELFYENSSIGTDTASALRIGIVSGIAGGIKEIIRNICNNIFKSNMSEISIIITGGYSELVLQALSENKDFTSILNKNLICDGIYSLFEQYYL